MSIAESRQNYSCRPRVKAESNRLSESVYHCVCTEASAGLNLPVWTLCVCFMFSATNTRHPVPFQLRLTSALFVLFSRFFLFLFLPSLIYFSDVRPGKLSEWRLFLPPPARQTAWACRLCGNVAEDAAAHRVIDFSPPGSSVAQIWGISTESHSWDEVSLIATIYADGESPINNVMINHRRYFFFTWTWSNTLLMLPFKTWPHYIYHGFMCSLCIQVNRGWHIKMAF